MGKIVEYLFTAIRGATKEILQIKNDNFNQRISIKKKDIISNIITTFIENNVEFIKKEFLLVINKKFEHMYQTRTKILDLESYTNEEFNKWLKENIFSFPNNSSKKEIYLIDKYWRNNQKNIFELNTILKETGYENKYI